MSFREDLIAARALIDTPDKWAALGGWNALLTAVGEERAYPAYDLLERVTPTPTRHYRHYENDPTTKHADIMRVFDHAINVASAS